MKKQILLFFLLISGPVGQWQIRALKSDANIGQNWAYEGSARARLGEMESRVERL